MSRKMNLYYNALCGALGGLLGSLVLGVLPLFASLDPFARAPLMGGIVGMLIAIPVGMVEGILSQAWLKALKAGANGAMFGLVGGAIGLLVGELTLRIMGGGVSGRSLGWALFGLLIGVGEGRADHSARKASYGAVGGAAGGLIGGSLFEVIAQRSMEAQSATLAVGLVVLGACIGSLIALVQELFIAARLMVLSGQLEGREFNLIKPITSMGSDDSSDVYLLRDLQVARRHAEIRREGARFMLFPLPAAEGAVEINKRPLASPQPLESGDRILIGNTLLSFRIRGERGSRREA